MRFALSYGRGGWCRVFADQLPDLYVRLEPNGGVWRITELYVDGRGQPLSAGMLRELPAAAIESAVNADPDGALTDDYGFPSIQMGVLASHYADPGKLGPDHLGTRTWFDDMIRSQIADSGVPTVKRRQHRRDRGRPEVPPLRAPENGLTDEFLGHVARAYHQAVINGQSPAKQLAAEVGDGTSVRTVHRWIYTARKRGILTDSRGPGRVN